MNTSFQSFRVLALAFLGVACGPALSNASIHGFGNFSGFTINKNDPGSPPMVPPPGSIELTNGSDEVSSIFYNTPQSITEVTACFTYQNLNSGSIGGFAFVIQNDPRGASAVGMYDPNSEECGLYLITKSVGIAFDLDDNATGFYTNGSFSGGEMSVNPLNLDAGDPINVQLTYFGSVLTASLTDSVTSINLRTASITNIPIIVGSDTTFVGITADSGNAEQIFSNFQFTNALPEPASGLSIAGVCLVLVRRRR